MGPMSHWAHRGHGGQLPRLAASHMMIGRIPPPAESGSSQSLTEERRSTPPSESSANMSVSSAVQSKGSQTNHSGERPSHQSEIELPDNARAVKVEIARRLIDRYYEGHSPEQKRKALEQLTKISE